jgi:hypothetical protein
MALEGKFPEEPAKIHFRESGPEKSEYASEKQNKQMALYP